MTTPNTRASFVLSVVYFNGRLIEAVYDPEEFLRLLKQLEHTVKRAITDNQATKIIVDPMDVDDDEL